MTREEMIAEACRMRADGEILRVIAARFGVSESTVLRWTDDEQAELGRARSRACKDRYRGVCVDCGASTNGSNGPGKASERCKPCTIVHSRKLTRAWILDSFAEWQATFGRPPRAAEWHRALARTLGRQDYLDRYAASGRRWPVPTTVADHFGSWNAGVAAAGLTPTPPGKYSDESRRREILRAACGTEERRQRIADLYREGLTYRQIGERMGITATTVASHLSRMRSEGWDLPYRAPWAMAVAA